MTDVRLLARAYAAGIPAVWATDVDVFLKMTLEEIGEEVRTDPVQLLRVIAAYVDSEEREPDDRT